MKILLCGCSALIMCASLNADVAFDDNAMATAGASFSYYTTISFEEADGITSFDGSFHCESDEVAFKYVSTDNSRTLVA